MATHDEYVHPKAKHRIKNKSIVHHEKLEWLIVKKRITSRNEHSSQSHEAEVSEQELAYVK